MLIEMPGISINKKMRKDNRFQGYVTINGEKNYVYGKTRTEVADKIKYLLKHGPTRKKRAPSVISGIPQTMDGFVNYFFEKFRRRKVAPKTFEADLGRYRKHIKPRFGNKPIKKISPGECQDLIDNLFKEGKGKTAEEVFSLLSIIFKGAISHGIITKNPLLIVYKEHHEKKHGHALSSDEIASLKNKLADSIFLQPFMILLYTGLRPNELASVKIDGPFIVAVNSKRKTKRIEYKRIPITPMLAPYLTDNLYLSTPDYLRRKFKELLPNHILYDLRTTFYTKCKECGVSEPALKHFVGHSNGALGNAYTDLSNEYLLQEGEKIRF